MRVLIYSESPEAQTILAQEREAGHHASLRNPYYFERPERCDKAVVWDAAIAKAFEDVGVDVDYHDQPEIETADNEASAVVEKTVRRKAKK